MSERSDAIAILIEMLGSEDPKVRVNAATRLLNTDGLPRDEIDQAVLTLRAVMNDQAAGANRVTAAEKLKNYGTPKVETVRDRQKLIAAMDNIELDAIIKNHIQFDPLLD